MKAAEVKATVLFFSSTGGVGSRFILAGEVEGEEDAEAISHTSGPVGDVSCESGA
jgi:hypothetical protein